MTDQLFIESRSADASSDIHPYYDFFKDSIGKGSGTYFPGIGEVYRTSSRYQKGYGLLGVSGRPRYGNGIGNILSSLWRVAFPMIKSGAQKLGTAALDVATNVASDALAGKDIKDSAKEHLTAKGVELLKNIKQAASDESKQSTTTIPTVSQSQASLVAPPPVQSKPTFRRLPRKRTGKVTFAQPRTKQAKYPALKYM